MSCDFRRDHATSPCLSTALGNRDGSRATKVGPSNCELVPGVRRECRVRGCARCRFSIKPPHTPKAPQRARVRNVAKTGEIIFSSSSRKRCTRRTWKSELARKPPEKRAFSIHGRDGGGVATDFMSVCRIRCRKAACHGRLRVSPAQDPKTLDGDSRANRCGLLILRRKQADRFLWAGTRPRTLR